MPICARCQHFNPDTAIICQKCSVPLGPQMRAQAGAAKNRGGNMVRNVILLVVVIAIAAASPSAFHAGKAWYLKFHLDSVTSNAMKSCEGPVTPDTPSSKVTEINDCLDKYEGLAEAKSAYAEFQKTGK